MGDLLISYFLSIIWFCRFSLSDDKYQVIKMPTVRSNGHSHFCLGRSEKGVYLALITKPRSLQVWVLNESCDEMEWVPKHENNLDSVFPRQTRRRWMLLQDLDKKDSTTFRKEHDEEIDFEWSSDGDDDSDHRGNVPVYRLPATIFQGYHGNVDNNALGFGNFPQPPIPMFYHGYHGNIDVLGFHPYKEIVFLCEAMQTGLAYHLKTSKMEILGKLPLVSSCEEILSNKSFTGVSLPYTPCWMWWCLRRTNYSGRHIDRSAAIYIQDNMSNGWWIHGDLAKIAFVFARWLSCETKMPAHFGVLIKPFSFFNIKIVCYYQITVQAVLI